MTTAASPVQVSAQAVEQQIRQDIRIAETLSTLLDKEQEALAIRSQNELGKILTEKQALLARLENSAQQRSKWVNFLVQHSKLSTQECWDRLLKELDANTLPPLWQEFQSKISSCQERNEINGKAISRGQRTLKQLLGILRGQHIESPKLYNSLGDTQGNSISRTVVKA